MAAATTRWELGPGAGPARPDAAMIGKTIAALEDLEAALPKLAGSLQSKEQLDERQRLLHQQHGTIEATGNVGETQFRVGERIGEGTFCVVFRGDLYLEKPGEGKTRPVALKFELKKTDSTQLRNEYRMYKKFGSSLGIPTIYSFGDLHFHKVLVMDLLGPSLEILFHNSNRQFSTKTVAMVAKQMVSRIQAIHENGIIYRDIKPENFLIGVASNADTSTIHLVDFGMAKLYRDPETKAHIPFGEAQSLSGTARYMSINAHCRYSQSRRDDLEALGHVFMYFLRGNLPWQGIKATLADQRYELMCEKKKSTTIEDLCADYPPEFAEYLSYTRSLPFEADPDYDYLRGLFDRVLEHLGESDDGRYDWLRPGSPVARHLHLHWQPLKPEPAPVPEPMVQEKLQLAPAAEISQGMPPSKGKAVLPGHAHMPSLELSPAMSPPGKRGRSEFASDLRPPVRARPRKTTFSMYDSEAQRTLLTLHREIMAKRYSFHRAVGTTTRSNISSGAIAAAAAAATAAAAAGSLAGGSSLLSSFSRARGSMRGGGGPSVVAPAFVETLDKTLASINSELEDMADKMLQGGDWMGYTRIRTWFDKLLAATQHEIERLKVLKEAPLEPSPADAPMEQPDDPTAAIIAAARARCRSFAPLPMDLSPPVSNTPAGPPGTAGEIVVDVEEMVRRDQALIHTTTGAALRATASTSDVREADSGDGSGAELAVARDAEIQPRRTSKERILARGSMASADLEPPQPGMETLSLEAAEATATAAAAPAADEPIKTDDDDDSGFALVYRTASGTQKVLRMQND